MSCDADERPRELFQMGDLKLGPTPSRLVKSVAPKASAPAQCDAVMAFFGTGRERPRFYLAQVARSAVYVMSERAAWLWRDGGAAVMPCKAFRMRSSWGGLSQARGDPAAHQLGHAGPRPTATGVAFEAVQG
jgi:hypothetical protein